jgi:hypothetical protein
MTTQIDFRTMPANVPVLCIPRVYANISEQRIRRIFEELNMGTLERIDIVGKNNGKGENFNRVYVHFHRWNDSENACIARERLLNGKEIKIIYDDPWFWKISAYRETVHSRERETQRKTYNKPTIQVDYDEDSSRYHDKRRYGNRRQEDKRPKKYDDRKQEDRRPPRQEKKEQYDNPDTNPIEPININYGDIVIPKRKPFKSTTIKIKEEPTIKEKDDLVENK